MLVVHPDLPVKSVAELIALAKSKPDELTFASSGNGTSIHLSGELFKSMAGVQMQHVPYKGSGPMLIDVMGGQVNLTFDNLSAAIQHIRAGKLRALAVTTAVRARPRCPTCPTVAEAGVPGYDSSSWNAIFVPAGTPQAGHRSAQQGARRDPQVEGDAEVLRRARAPNPAAARPKQLDAFVRSETDKWAKAVKASGAKVD